MTPEQTHVSSTQPSQDHHPTSLQNIQPSPAHTPTSHSTVIHHTETLPRTIRIIDKPFPELTYGVHITGPGIPRGTHTLTTEPTLLHIPSSTLSFSSYGPLFHWLRKQCPSNLVPAIKKVRWEAHCTQQIGSAATLSTAKRLLEALPGLEEVVLCLAFAGAVDGSMGEVAEKNLAEWEEGLKQRLSVRIRRMSVWAWKKGIRRGSRRTVTPVGEAREGGMSKKDGGDRTWV